MSEDKSFRASGILIKNGNTLTNSYYLYGVEGTTGITPESGAIVFYKTLEGLELPENEEDYPMTTADVVNALNNYIAHPDEGVDTTGWCKWVVVNDLPALDFNYEWDPTAGEDGEGAFVPAT